MSLLFSVRPPQKSDVSALLHPSLGELLVVCYKYQAKKLQSKSRPPSESEQHPPDQHHEKEEKQKNKDKEKDKEEEDKEEPSATKTDGDDGPVKKRRKTLEGDEQSTAKAATSPSDKPGTSKDESNATAKKEKAQESSQKQAQKTGTIWGARPPTDWVDSLVKAIQSTITKVPAQMLEGK